MKRLTRLQHRYAWLNLPTVSLLALLQRTPVLRTIAACDPSAFFSSAGSIVKTAVAAAASLGAIDSLAGATTLVATTSSPVSAKVGTAIPDIGFTVSNTINIGSWQVGGSIPPGLALGAQEGGSTLTGPGTLDATTPGQSDGYGDYSGGNDTTTPVLYGTPTRAGSYTFTLQAFEFGAADPGSPNLASGVFSYTVNVASNVAQPAFTAQPISETMATGASVVFSASASGSPAYQWYLGASAIPGATSTTLLVSNPGVANAGSYTCQATNGAGTVSSSAATLTLASTTNIGRLANISTRAVVGTGSNILIAGFVVGGGTDPTKPILIRADGPSLAAFGVAGTLADPTLGLYEGGTQTAFNDNWGGNAQITAESAALGAFALAGTGSLDSALYLPALAPGGYTAEVAGNDSGTGVALAELYDATASGSFSGTTTPRLVNISTRAQVGTGSNIMIAGFVVSGSTAKTVLLRASGPALATFGISGTLPDPQLTLLDGSGNTLALNAGWGGNAQIAATAATVGAFTWTSASSLDAALLITLQPGSYTAQVAGASGDTGDALVEVYDVP